VKFFFERECRTPYSEAYTIVTNTGERVGRVDLHFTSTVVHATLCVDESLLDSEIRELIGQIDDELVMSTDAPRDDFIVVVYRGREAGTFSDEILEGEEEE